jgi:tetratricopeptide (TPR) repeat protein
MKNMRKILTSTVLISAILLLIGNMSSCQSSTNKQKSTTNQTGTKTVDQPGQTTPGSEQMIPVELTNENPAVKKLDHPVLLDKNSVKNPDNTKSKMLKNMAANSENPQAPSVKIMNDPDQRKAYELFLSGAKKSQEGDQKGAIEDLTQSLNLVKTPGTLLKRGFSELLDQQYQNAINDMNEALKMTPNLGKAFFIRGVGKFELQDFKGAEEDLKKFIEKDRTVAMAFNYLAGCRFMNKDFKGALENYEMVVKLNPKYPDIYTNRGMMKHYLNDLKGAVEDYNKALSVDPENATAYNNRGAAKLNLKDPNGALADFTKAISIKQDYADAYDNRGKAKLNLGDKEGACEDWQRSYSLGLESSRDLIIKFCK